MCNEVVGKSCRKEVGIWEGYVNGDVWKGRQKAKGLGKLGWEVIYTLQPLIEGEEQGEKMVKRGAESCLRQKVPACV